jgi:protein TonB
MMTWTAFLNDEVAERLARVRSLAVGLSAVLHATLVLVVFAEFSQPSAATGDVGVEVTFEPAPGVEQVVTPEPTPPSNLLLSQPAPGDPPAKEPQPAAEPQTALSHDASATDTPHEQPEAAAALAPPPPIESHPEPEASVALPPPVAARLEEALPGAESPPAVDARDFARARPMPPKAQVAAVQLPAAKRVAAETKPGDSPGPAGRPPAAALRSDPAQRKVEEDYFWQIVRRISQYRFYSNTRENAQQGLVVTRMTIGRDGRLMDVALMKSSGFPDLDSAVVETIRRASPFAPLPADLGRDQQIFIVPVNYTRER